MGKVVDLTGQRFGRLRVLGQDGYTRVSRNAVWVCQCDCGNTARVDSGMLRHGDTASCGCYRKEVIAERNRRHGMRRNRVYTTWVGMRQRCGNPNAHAYENYGGRGITVCERWRNFQNFYADMGERPPGLTLDRIDNDGNYEPGNCRWATRQVQSQNQRKRARGETSS